METLQLEFHTAEEQTAILKAIKNTDHRVQILLMMDCGCRPTEARTIDWKRIDFQKKTVQVRTLKQKGKDKFRTVPMSERLYDAFDALITERQKKGKPLTGVLFPSPRDPAKPIGRSAVNNMIARLSADIPQAGKMKPHKLRHTAATNLRMNGADIIQIRDFLGHKDSKTTDIYTHSTPDELRQMINASTPKPGFWQRWKARLFSQKRSVINLLIPETDFIIGREKEQKRIQEQISRGINVLITGEIGVGKTHLLNSLNFDKQTLVFDDCSDFKKSIAAAILHICGDKDAASQMLFNTSDLKSVERKMSTASLPNLVQTLKDATKPNEYLLKIGTLDNITPKGVTVLESLKDHFTIIATARKLKMEATSFAWNFENVELKPLQRPDSLKLIYRLIGDLEVIDLDGVMTKVYETSEGNPRKLRELCERLRREPFVNLDSVTEVADSYIGRQVREFDFSMILLVILGGFVVMRYWGRATNDKDLQFIGACIMLVVMFARFFFRSAKRRTL